MSELRGVATAIIPVLLLWAVPACDSGGSGGSSAEQGESSKKSASKKKKKKKGSKKGGDSELPFEATGTVAVVDGEKITAKEYNKVVRDKFANSRRPLPKAMAKKMKTKALKSMIDKHLIEREIKKADVSASDDEVQKEFKKFTDRFPNDKAFKSFLKFRNTSKEELKKKIRKDVKLRKILRKRKGIEITEKDAKKYYEENPKEYDQPEKVKARHILIETPRGKKGNKKKEKKAKKKAEKIAKKAKKEGSDFAKLAKKHSEGPSAKKGGDLGYFTRDRMVEKFAEKAFSMKNGEVAGPVKTKFGYHIIKREGHKKAKKQSFDEVKSDIVSKLERKKFRGAIDKFSSELREKAKIKKMPENIKVNVSEKKGGPGGLGGLGAKGGGNLKLKMNKLKGIGKGGKKKKGSKKGKSGSKKK